MRWILQKLLGLDPSVLKPEATLDLRFAQAWPLWIVLFVLASIAIYSAVIYRKEGRPVGPGLRCFLAALRIAVLILLVLLLCEPILAVEEVELTKPYVVFMIDTSQSMNLHDRFPEEEDVERARKALPEKFALEGTPRADMERDHLGKLSRIEFINEMLRGEDTDPRKTSLARRYHLRFYEFARDIRPKHKRGEGGAPAEGIEAGMSEALGTETRMGDCMRKVLNELRGQTVAGMVIFTDGRSNAGDNPAEVARIAAKRSVPIFPVGIGDRRIYDVQVTRVEAPERARSGDDVSFVATLVQKGYAGQKAKVVLRRGTERVFDKEVEFPEDGKPFGVDMVHRPEVPGKVDYTVVVEPRTGELVSDNNSRSHTLNVVEGKTKVLYVEGQDLPRWEYRFMKHAMMRDHTLQVSTLLAERGGEFFYDGNYRAETYPETQKDMFDRYDVIIFGDVNPEIFTQKQLDLTAQFVGQHGGGFMMIAGERYAPAKYIDRKNPISALIPVRVNPSDEAFLEMGRTIVNGFKPEVTQAGWQSAVLRLENDERANRDIWLRSADEGGLPPFFWYLPVPEAKPATTVLLRHPTDKARGEKQKRPLLVVGRYGAGLTMFVGTDEFWRWRFAQGDRYFYRFYAQAIQYLASARGGKTKLSILNSDRPVYSLGEPVKLTAEVKVLKGTKYEPLEADSVKVTLQVEKLGEQPPLELKKVPGSPGTFEGRLMPKGRGKYHAWVKSYDPAKKRGGECDFEVKLPQLEYEDPRMDEESLREVARAGGKGGRFLFADEIRGLHELITEPERKNPVVTEHPLWDNWRLFALFSLVIIVEWVLRKRVRMM
ncbi:MAG: hypothetical protein ACYTGB_00965 [Planctomycetota bacterium]